MGPCLDDAGVRAAILKRLNALTPSTTRRWGRMNAHQAVCHLSDSFRVVMQTAPAPSMSNFFSRTVMKWVALHTAITWPHGVKTMPGVDQEIGGTKPVEFETDRRELVSLVEKFAATKRTNFQPHPIFGQMTDAEWQHWGYRHMDHHLRQFGM